MIRAVVIGASGYSGAELAWLLRRHPRVELTGLYVEAHSASAGQPLASLYPRYERELQMTLRPLTFDAPAELAADVAFLALPPAQSLLLAPKLLAQGLIVIDLSGAFRLQADAYPAHYGFTHTETAWLAKAVYGLPEFNAAAIADAQLIAAPGCYATAAVLALKPLVMAGLLDEDAAPLVHAVSGVSGAGKTPSPQTHACELSLEAYGVFSHRHQPEMRQVIGASVLFTPVLGHFKRGIFASCYARVREGVTLEAVEAAMHKAYLACALVRFSRQRLPSVAAVEGTAYCDLHAVLDPEHRQLVVFSALDNLLKGASAQALQAMNIRLGFPQTMALL